MSKARDLANAGTALTSVSATELGYVDGVTSAIQTQIDAKLATATASSTYIPKTLTTTTGDIIYASGANTPARLGIGSTDQILKVTGGVPVWATPAGGGKVLQVVMGTTSTETTISTTTYTDTGLSATITPTSATSKILVLTSQASRATGNGIEETGLVIRLVRGSTAIFNDSNSNMNLRLQINNITATMGISAYVNYSYLDSPATTSATTYKTQGASRTSSMSAIFQTGSTQTSTMILMEIGA